MRVICIYRHFFARYQGAIDVQEIKMVIYPRLMCFLLKSFKQAAYIKFGIQIFGIGYIVFVVVLLKIISKILENLPLLVVILQ